MDHNLELLWLFKLAIIGVIIFYWLTKDNTKGDIYIVEHKKAPVLPTQKVYEEKPMQEHKPSLYQRIKAQPIAIKRFSIIVAVLWIILNHIDFWKYDRFQWSGRHFNDYFIATYLPLIILYGIYWIISGIKKES